MRKFPCLIMVLSLFLLLGPGLDNLKAIPSDRLIYDVAESGNPASISFEIAISRLGVRYDYRDGERRHSLIYRSDTNPAIYTVDHHHKRGFKITNRGIDHYIKLMEAKRKNIKNRLGKLPERRRKQIKQRMDLSPINPNKELKRPQLKMSGDTLWNGLTANTGQLITADGSEGTVVVSTDHLVDLSPQQQETLSEFTDFLYRWINISSQANDSDMSHPRNLIAEQYTKLISYRDQNSKMILKDWDQINRSPRYFQPPETYQIEKLKNLNNRKEQSR